MAAGVSASVAVERVAAGWHFLTDVLAGALVGTTVGIVVPYLHLRRLRVMPAAISSARALVGEVSVAGRWQ